ncbi:hypothetical protein AB0E85_29665 [Streptomyces sp. NPDC029044]|uniref:hypothetical protein n=1 Tax=Streptomyces sp. NPDC029044 TaxID=3157198 RepID=UPI0033E38EDF
MLDAATEQDAATERESVLDAAIEQDPVLDAATEREPVLDAATEREPVPVSGCGARLMSGH